MEVLSPVITRSAITKLQLILQEEEPGCSEVSAGRPGSRLAVSQADSFGFVRLDTEAVRLFHAKGDGHRFVLTHLRARCSCSWRVPFRPERSPVFCPRPFKRRPSRSFLLFERNPARIGFG